MKLCCYQLSKRMCGGGRVQERLPSQHSASAGYRQTYKHWLVDRGEPEGTKCQACQPLSGYDRELPSNQTLAKIDESHLGASVELSV